MKPGIVFTVPQNHVAVIERFGKFSRVVGQGLRTKLPFIERARDMRLWDGEATKEGFLIELSEQQTDTSPRQCQTSDSVTVTTNASVYWRITDIPKAVYDVDKLPRMLPDAALNALRARIGALTLEQLVASRAVLSERIAAELSETCRKWGVVISRVEIQDITYSDATASAMLEQMAAERRQRAAVAEAQGYQDAEIRRAKGDSEAAIVRAEGRSRALEIIAKAEQNYLASMSQVVGAKSAGELLVAQKVLAGFEAISKNPADKVFLPNSFHGIVSFDVEKNPRS